MGEVSLAIKLDEDLSHVRVNFMVGRVWDGGTPPMGACWLLKVGSRLALGAEVRNGGM